MQPNYQRMLTHAFNEDSGHTHKHSKLVCNMDKLRSAIYNQPENGSPMHVGIIR